MPSVKSIKSSLKSLFKPRGRSQERQTLGGSLTVAELPVHRSVSAPPASPVSNRGDAAFSLLPTATNANPVTSVQTDVLLTIGEPSAGRSASESALPVSPVNTGVEAPSMPILGAVNTEQVTYPVPHSAARSTGNSASITRPAPRAANTVESAPSPAHQTTKNIFKGTLSVLSSVFEGLPIPGAKAIVDTVVKVINVYEVCAPAVCCSSVLIIYFQATKANEDALKALDLQCRRLYDIVLTPLTSKNVSDISVEFKNIIEHFRRYCWSSNFIIPS